MIYWDHNATSPLWPEVARLLAERAQAGAPANPSSVHQAGRVARQRLEDARRKVASLLGCAPREVVFTASGTEANALCLKGAYATRQDRRRQRVVTSQIEHPSVLGALAQLEQSGVEVVHLPVDSGGRVPLAALQAALTEEVALCSLMYANNETGVLQPLKEAAERCRELGILFHTDAVQALGKVPGAVRLGKDAPFSVEADLLTFSAHKFGGPTGIAGCAVRREVPLEALAPGHQEDGRRGGTPNVAYAEACALALELTQTRAAESARRTADLRDAFEREVRARLPGTEVNGAAERVANTSNLHFPGVDGEALLIALDLEGICASLGAACASGSLSPSHVLLAMGRTPQQARGSLRFSLGSSSDAAEVEKVVEALARLVPHCR